MANKHETLESLFTGIADAIRLKTGKTTEIIADNFPEEIENIPSGSSLDTSDATAQVTDIINGKTAYVDGEKLEGTLVVNYCYKGTTEPDSSLGEDGDLYFVKEA